MQATFGAHTETGKSTENIQINATKLVLGISTLTHQEMLQKLKLPSLRYRRLGGDMIEVFKNMRATVATYDKEVSKGFSR